MHRIIAEKKQEIARICRRYDVRRLEVFGSAARATDFDPARSDVDFLVEFQPPLVSRLLERFLDLQDDLQGVLGRKVDLTRDGTIQNPYRIASIDEDREVVFES